MNKQVAADLIAVLGRSTDKTLILKCLLKLRTDLIGRNRAGIELFYRLNGIPPLIRLISKPYEKIIDVALSILANCCVNKACCKQAIAQGVVPPLLNILKCIPSTSVQCRACRLLGNLARESNEKICGLAKGIGVAIAALLADTRDVNTLNMAVRAARLLWNEMPFYDEFVRHSGVQRILHILIGQLQVPAARQASASQPPSPPAPDHMDIHVRNIQFMESVNSKVFDREILKKEPARTDGELFSYPTEADGTAAAPASDGSAASVKHRRELIGELMHSLQTLTARLSFRVVKDVFAVEHSCHCIVYLARPDSPLRAVALRILSNLAKSVSASTEYLSKADAITAACRLITHDGLEPPLSETEERHCIAVVCLLASDACNRAKIRISGAFTRIMEIAKRTKCNAVLTSILMGLQNFRYDNNSIDQMISVGLVSVLVERLERLTRDMSETHVKRVLKRPLAECSGEPDAASETERRRSRWTSAAAADDDGGDGSDDERDAGGDREAHNDERARHAAKRPMIVRSPDVGVPMGANPASACYSYPSSPCSSASSSSPLSQSPRARRAEEATAGCGWAGGDVDSEYSPVCSDIEEMDDDGRATAKRRSGSGGGTAGGAAAETPANEQSSEVMRFLEQCSSAALLVDEPILSEDESGCSDTTKSELSPQAATESPDAVAKMKTVHLIIDTLCNVSFRLKYASDLCTAPILSTLVRACRVAYRRRDAQARWDAQGAPQVLSHIFEETLNFVPIIKQNIIFKIYEMTQIQPDHDDCAQCNDIKIVGQGLLDQLTTVGETGYGRGEMARMLLRGDRRTQSQIAVVTTYIISQPRFLHTLLVEHGGLYTVMECIVSKCGHSSGGAIDASGAATTPADDLSTDAANGLTALASVLGISVPACDETLIASTPGFDMAEVYALPNADCRRQRDAADGNASASSVTAGDSDDIVWFVAGDDDSSAAAAAADNRVAFDRATIVGYSDVFASMLQNNFREARENQIRLRQQTIGGVRYFLDAVRQLAAGTGAAVATPVLRRPHAQHMDAVLEAYDMAQVYMLPDLERAVFNMVLHLLSAETALCVFTFAMRQHKAQLADIAIAYYLSCRVAGERKVRMYREADDAEFYKEWSQMMLDMVVYSCQNCINKF